MNKNKLSVSWRSCGQFYLLFGRFCKIVHKQLMPGGCLQSVTGTCRCRSADPYNHRGIAPVVPT